MSENLMKKLIFLLNAKNINDELVSNTLSVEERKSILFSNELAAKVFLKECQQHDICLFNETEFQEICDENKSTINYNTLDFYSGLPYGKIVRVSNDEFLIRKYEETGDFSYLCNIKNKWGFEYIINHFSYEDLCANLGEDAEYWISNQLLNIPELNKRIYTHNKNIDMMLKALIIGSFEDDNRKIRYMSSLPRKYRGSVISHIEDDDLKSKKLKLSSFYTREDGLDDLEKIIKSFKDDHIKEKYLHKYNLLLSQDLKINILLSFKNQEFLQKNLQLLKPKENIRTLLYSSKISNDIKLEIINKLVNSQNIVDCLDAVAEDKELFFILANKIVSFDKKTIKIINEAFQPENLEAYNNIISRIPMAQLKKYIKSDPENINVNLLLKVDDEKLILNTIPHICFYDYNDSYNKIYEIVARKYKLNYGHLLELGKITRSNILKYVQNKNVINAINLDDEDFAKYLNIFKEENLTLEEHTENTILNSIFQRKFGLDKPDIKDIFSNTMHAIVDGNIPKAKKYIDLIINELNLDEYKNNSDNKEKLLNGLLNGNNSIIDLYAKMASSYVNKERSSFVKNEILKYSENDKHYEYDRYALGKYLLMIYDEETIIEKMYNYFEYYKDSSMGISFTPDEEKLLDNKDLLKKIITFLKNHGSESTVEIKENTKVFKDLLYKTIGIADIKFSGKNVKLTGVKKDHSVFKKRNYDGIAVVMTDIDVESLKNTVLSNEELYNKLLEYLKKYKFLGWKDNYKDICIDSDLYFGYDTIASIISNFSSLVSENKLTSFIDEANCLTSDSSIYSYILGEEDFLLIARNPAPNASSEIKATRLEKAINLLKSMHERKHITIPPINKDFELKNGKRINITIGNMHDPINLTYGERTGSCMRIGGAGESLFSFCLLDKNGFHISFSDPNTNKLVSRVSGFRNGNTVFLNQLRESLSPDYTNDDLVAACDMVAKELVNMTKNSEYPINNVVVSDQYCYGNYKKEAVDLQVKNIKKSLPDFYSDVDEEAIVIASSNPSNKLIPVKLGAQNTEEYNIIRSKPRKSVGEKAIKSALHIEALDQFYSDIDIDKIELKEKDYTTTYFGEDWYVAIDKNGKIQKYIMKNCNNLAAATEEINGALSLLSAENKEENKYEIGSLPTRNITNGKTR